MRRREFITLLGGTAVAWPLAARAQQPERIRRIGVLMGYAESDSEGRAFVTAFRERLQKLGWTEGRNIRIDTRWATPGDAELRQRFSRELVALQPDLIFSHGTPNTATLLQQTRTIPIIFANVSDPVGSSLVTSYPRPGGRVALMFNPAMAPYSALYFHSIEAAAPFLAMQPFELPVHDEADITRAFATMAGERSTGAVVLLDAFTLLHRDLIISSAAEYRLPIVFADRQFAESGGSVAYGVDRVDQFRQAGIYIDRIFKGTKPEDLPVQQPTRFELVINLKTAKKLGLTIPHNLLIRADEVIE